MCIFESVKDKEDVSVIILLNYIFLNKREYIFVMFNI